MPCLRTRLFLTPTCCLPRQNPNGIRKEAQEQEKCEYFPGPGKRRALLIGCNYIGQVGELRGCINDVKNIQKLLTETYGWSASDITTMTDHDKCHRKPTKENILAAARRLVKDAAEGDSFFFFFAGHGAQRKDPEGLEDDGMNETLLPLDFKKNGMIVDSVLSKILVESLPSGCRLTAFIDACRSGTGLDLPFKMKDESWKLATNPLYSQGDVQMISGSQDSGTSADAMINGVAGGALTSNIVKVLSDDPNPTYIELMERIRAGLKKGNFKQWPVLTSSQSFSLDRIFCLDCIMHNKNKLLGRVVNQKFGSQENPNIAQFIETMGVVDSDYPPIDIR